MKSIAEIASSARRNLTMFSLLGFFVFIMAHSLSSYSGELHLTETHVLSRLQAITKTVVLQIDAELHQRLTNRYINKDDISNNEQDNDYLKLHNTLKNVQKANGIKTPIYTLVLQPEASTTNLKNAFFFGITSSSKPYFRHLYTPSKELVQNYQTGGVLKPYGDKHGKWLSAFAPFKTKEGKVVGIVQIDIRFEQFIKDVRKRFIQNTLGFALFFLLFLGLFILYIFKITSELSQQHQNTEKSQLLQSNILFTNQQLQSTNHHLTSIIDSLVSGVMVLDEAGRVLHLNPIFIRIFGSEAEQMLGKNFKIISPPKFMDMLERASSNRSGIIQQELILPSQRRCIVSITSICAHKIDDMSNSLGGFDGWNGFIITLQPPSPRLM